MSNMRNPVWGPDQAYIDCEILMSGGEWAPFTASRDDPDPKIRALYQALSEQNPAAYEPPTVVITGYDVNVARNRAIAAGFEYEGHRYQSDPLSLMALLLTGLEASEVAKSGRNKSSWHGGSEKFSWIDADNNVVDLTAGDVLGLCKAARQHIADVVLSARAIKDQPEIPADFADTL